MKVHASIVRTAALAAGLSFLVGDAAQATQPSILRNAGAEATKDARTLRADFHFKDVQPVNNLIPPIVIGDTTVRIGGTRAIIDARIINILLVRKSYRPPAYNAASTAQSIDAWTGTVLAGVPQGYGTTVDQWVSMTWYLGPY